MERFVKYHGLGNDFLVVEATAADIDPECVTDACDRRRGAGADGVLVLEEGEASDVRMTVYNADGSRPEMCGNGIRCAARHVAERMGGGDEIDIVTDAGPRRCRIQRRGADGWTVSAEMGAASWESSVHEREFGGETLALHPVDLGNPHAVVFTEPSLELVEEVGRALNDSDPAFPDGVNVEFVEVGDSDLDVTVYERGVGLTEACGTGACAAAVAAWETGRVESNGGLTVRLPGGELEVRRDDEGTIWLTGPATSVYAGRWLDGEGVGSAPESNARAE